MSYIQIPGYKGHTSGDNGPITRVVIHGTVSPCVKGGARNVAAYFQSANSGGLAHFVVDPYEIVQCCPENVACWHAPPNHGSIGVELCDMQDGKTNWFDPEHSKMLSLTRTLVHDLCSRYKLPLKFVNATGLIAGEHGVTTHYEVSQAFHQSDHSDPGKGFGDAMAYLLSGAPVAVSGVPSWYQHPLDLHNPLFVGPDVKHVQQVIGMGTPDGVYGPNTKQWVLDWQRKHGLVADGVVGPTTAKLIG